MVRFRVCFKCKLYIPIHSTAVYNDTLEQFNKIHRKHPVQTVNISDLDGSYKVWISKQETKVISLEDVL